MSNWGRDSIEMVDARLVSRAYWGGISVGFVCGVVAACVGITVMMEIFK